MTHKNKLSYDEIIKRIDPEAIQILKNNPIIHNRAELERFLRYEWYFHAQLAEIIRDHRKANTVGKAYQIMCYGESSTPEPARKAPGEIFIEALDKTDGMIQITSRILNEIDIERQWGQETQTEFREQLSSMQSNLEKMIVKFDNVIKNP